MKRLMRTVGLAVVACAVLAGAAVAGSGKTPVRGARAASPGPGKPASAAPSSGASRAPNLYTQVNSGFLTARTGTQTRGLVSCPALTRPFGGGAFITSSSLFANINSSIPSGNGWLADVNNASGADTTFQVWVVCAKPPKHYQVVTTGPLLNPAGEITTGEVICPAGTVILGGGAYSSSASTSVNFLDTFPELNGWRVDMSNASSSDATNTAYAICSKRPLTWTTYTIINSAYVSNPVGTEAFAFTTCPPGTGVLSGGGIPSAAAPGINVNTTYPTGTGSWGYDENNASIYPDWISAYAICAGI
jgi:hypothetical protein